MPFHLIPKYTNTFGLMYILEIKETPFNGFKIKYILIIGKCTHYCGMNHFAFPRDTPTETPPALTPKASAYASVRSCAVTVRSPLIVTVAVLIYASTSGEVVDAQLMAVIGESYEDLGERDLALDWLGRALANGCELVQLERTASLDGLREDPRFLELIESVQR